MSERPQPFKCCHRVRVAAEELAWYVTRYCFGPPSTAWSADVKKAARTMYSALHRCPHKRKP